MAEDTRTEVLLRGGNFVRRQITEISLGSQDAFLAQLIDNTPTPPCAIANMKVKRGPLPDAIFNIVMSSSRSELVLATELTELPFICTFERAAGVDRYQPAYGAEPLPGIPYMRDPFPCVRLGGRVIFAMVFNRNEDGTPPWTPYKCFMGLKLNADDEVRHFNYPNHYADGRVCMGRDWDANPYPLLPDGVQNRGASLLAIFRHAVATFYETRANSDLATSHTTRFFSKDPDGQWLTNNTTGINSPDLHMQVISARALNSLVPAVFSLFNNATGTTD